MSDSSLILAKAPRATITKIEITRHRLHFDPPFHASWDTRPRTFWDAAIVQVHTDLGVTGIGSGDMMLGFEGHEHLFVGQDALALERHWRIINNINFHWGRCWPLDLALFAGCGSRPWEGRRPSTCSWSRRARLIALSGSELP